MKRFLFILTLFTLLSGQLFAQLQVEGTVKNTDGETLPGVNITIKGTTTGTVTDLDGHYNLSGIPADGVLEFSFLGMLSETMVVGDQTIIDMMLIDDIQSLDEIVVVGYGTVKRANLTGAVADINAEKLDDIASGDLTATLEGRLAGVKVGSSTGKPGESSTITIRTTSSFGSVAERPLFVIDGIVYDNSSYNNTDDGQERFNQLDPTEIESISILKDASAAVYGSRSTAGVILVKTKQGKEGKTSVTYNGSFGISKATSFPKMLSAYEHASMMNYIYANDKDADPKPTKYDYYADDELEEFKNLDYNWVDELWKPSIINRHTLNVSGGTEKVKYFIGGSYFKETGSLNNLDASRYSFRSNLQAQVTKGLTARLGISIGNNQSMSPYYSDERSGYVLRDTYKRLLTAPRWAPPSIDGKPVKNNMDGWQPYGLLNSGSYKASTSNYSTISGGLDYEVPKVRGLTMGVQFSYNAKSSFSKRNAQDYTVYQFKPAGTNRHLTSDELLSEDVISNDAGLQQGSERSSSYQLNTQIAYGRSIGAHNFNVMLIYEQTEAEGYGYNTTLTGVSVPGVDQMWAFNQNAIQNQPSASESGRLGYIGRLNYSYFDKYIVEGTFRADASQKFHPDYVWGYFPAVSAGWIVSEENFFKNNINFANFLKIRGTAGITGNDNVGAYKWKSTYSGNNSGAMFGTTLTNAIDVSNDGLISPQITWQKSNYYNGGLDARFLNSKIDFGLDVFYRFTYDILAKKSSSKPTTAGIKQIPEENYGEMYAKGFEFSLGYNGKITRDIEYYVEGNFSYTKHRKLLVDQSPAAVGRWDDQLLNDPSNQPGYICLGIIRTEEDLANVAYDSIDEKPIALGQLIYADIRGENYSEGPDGKIDKFDQTIIAEYTNPPYNYGFSLGASWKGLSLDMTFTGEFGHKVFVQKDEQVLPTATSNVFAFWGDYWTPENPNASMPRPYAYGKEEQVSTFWMRDGNTLRLSNINIAYSIPKKLLQKASIGELRIYFTARNVWTIISPFDYKDPSVSKAYDYPMTKSYNFGIKLTL